MRTACNKPRRLNYPCLQVLVLDVKGSSYIISSSVPITRQFKRLAAWPRDESCRDSAPRRHNGVKRCLAGSRDGYPMVPVALEILQVPSQNLRSGLR